MFGPHLTIDGYGGDQQKLADRSLVYKFLNNLPDIIGMTKLHSPQIINYKGGGPDPGGLSGFVIIAESHISIHTFPQKKFASIDIFSCKPFNPEPIVHIVKRTFDFEKLEINFFGRGKEYQKMKNLK
jgi:S-adenosylmethionine decarboxylase